MKVSIIVTEKKQPSNIGLFPTKDMQNPPLLLLFPLGNGPILIDDAQSAESNEKTNFQFLRFLFLGYSRFCSQFSNMFTLKKCFTFLRPKKKYFTQKKKFLQKWSNMHGRCAMTWNESKINFIIFIFWVMVDFILKIHQKINLISFL